MTVGLKVVSVDLKQDYFGFSGASKYLAGYGLAGTRGMYRNLAYIGVLPRAGRRVAGPVGKGARGAGQSVRRVR